MVTIFKKKLCKAIEDTGEFVTDTIEMDDLRKSVKAIGFDDVVFVAGEQDSPVYLLAIQQIKH